ncbi:MAG: phosphotransferase [Caulobacterales bacterium]
MSLSERAKQERAKRLEVFLREHGWSEATRLPLAGDASTRRYERLVLPGYPAILMDAPPSAESAPCPPNASADERIKLGYNASARLAASRVDAFVALAGRLRYAQLSAPEIFAHDSKQGFAIVEDLGDSIYAAEIRNGASELDLYSEAIDTLLQLHKSSPPRSLEYKGASWPMMLYDDTALLAETELLLDWYAERRCGITMTPAARATWRDAWSAVFPVLGAARPVLVLRDYHAENLLWLPNREPGKRTGLLDFQDALAGHPAYDLVSLLEDARRDVDPDLAQAMIERYVAGAFDLEVEPFHASYAVLGAQRNAKIIGIFCRLALRDSKDRYLDLLPRVQAHFTRNIAHPALAPVARWFEANLPATELVPA